MRTTREITQKYSYLIDYIALVIVAISAITIYCSIQDFSIAWCDDSYVTFRYARNIAEGHGFVYNVGEDALLGTTTPLFCLILALLGVFLNDYVVLSHVITMMSLIGLGFVIFLIFRVFGKKKTGLSAALLVVSNPLLIKTFGHETIFYTFLIFTSFYFYIKKKYEMSYLFMGLTAITRIDGFILLAAVILWDLVSTKRIQIKPLLVFLIVTSPWFLYSIVTFGSPFPETLGAKVAQGRSGILWWVFSKGIIYTFVTYLVSEDFIVFFAVLSLFGLLYIHKKHQLIPILLWSLLYIIMFTVLSIPDYHWYYAPLAPVLIILETFGIIEICEVLKDNKHLSDLHFNVKINISSVYLFLLLMVMYPNTYHDTLIFAHPPADRSLDYRSVGLWLNENTPNNATIALTEIGAIAYYADRRIIDLIGLLAPDIAQHSLKYDFTYAIVKYKPDYVAGHPDHYPWMISITSSDWFKNSYMPIKLFKVTEKPFFVYKKVSDRYIPDIMYDFIYNFESKDSQFGREAYVQMAVINGQYRPSIYLPMSGEGKSQIKYNDVWIPEGGVLEFAVGLDPKTWMSDKCYGVLFQVIFENGTWSKIVFSEFIDPKNNPSQRRWHEYQIDLKDYYGSRLDISFVAETDKKDSSIDSLPLWGNPQIIRRTLFLTNESDEFSSCQLNKQ